jgi:predicted ATPase
MKNLPLHIEEISLKEGLDCNPEEYPFNIPVIQNFKSLELRKPVTFIIGENGSGKSTLLEAIAVCYGFNPEGGSKNFNFSTVASHSSFHNYLRITKSYNRAKDGYFLRAESFYNVASEIDNIKDGILAFYGGKSLHEQSHGESFFALLQHRLGGNGVYIFDEPEAALSPMRLLSLLVRIDDLVKLNSQFIISTHSPILMAYPNADIYKIANGKLELTKLEDTEHFVITKYFVNQRERLLKELGIEVFS